MTGKLRTAECEFCKQPFEHRKTKGQRFCSRSCAVQSNPALLANLRASKAGVVYPKRGPISKEHSAKLSVAQKARFQRAPVWSKGKPGTNLGRKFSPEWRAKLSESAKRRGNNWRGGAIGEAFAAVLCPAGFAREHWIKWDIGQWDCFQLDFAHVEGKVNIELDGPGHCNPELDPLRDAIMKRMGWKIIRIRHGKEL